MQLKAMIFLGVNCGFGNADCGTLPLQALDLDGGWISHPRQKTGIRRRCPLWPETIEALRTVLAERRTPKHDTDDQIVFITKFARRWMNGESNPIAQEFRRLLKSCRQYRNGIGFYSLRHVFQTVGEEAGETVTKSIMGHADSSMSAVYRERISDSRLRAVVDHVHQWLYGPPPAGGPRAGVSLHPRDHR